MSDDARISRRSLLGLGLSQVRERFDDQIPDLRMPRPRRPRHRRWDAAPPAGSERFTRPAAERLVAACGVGEGERVLDWGCGQGEVALAAARAGASVTAIDSSPEMLDRAATLAAADGVAVEWLEQDGLALDLGDGWFDRVLSGFGVIWSADPPAAVREMLRVARPGATVGFTAWSNVGFTGRMLRVARDLGLLPATPSPTAYSREERLRQDIEPFVERLEVTSGLLELDLGDDALADFVDQAAGLSSDELVAELEEWLPPGEHVAARYVEVVAAVPAV